MPRLFHVSDRTGIAYFEPLPDRRGEARVWAIAESHLVNYLLPRDCPRVTYHRRPDSSDADVQQYLEGSDHVVAIEEAWFERARDSRLTLYEMPEHQFRSHDPIAGYYTSCEPVTPVAERTISQPLQLISIRGSELRVLPCLWQLREEIASSTLGFSIIRFRNAQPPPAGFISRFPVTTG